MTMLPRIQAGELLDAVRMGGLGFGSYDKKDAEAMLRELRERTGQRRIKPRKASGPVLAMMGIGMVKAPSQASPQTGENDG